MESPPSEGIHNPTEPRNRPTLATRYPLPFSDESDLPPERFRKLVEDGDLLEFSHSLDDQIGGQLAAGFTIVGFFEDSWSEATALDRWFKTTLNTRARRD